MTISSRRGVSLVGHLQMAVTMGEVSSGPPH